MAKRWVLGSMLLALAALTPVLAPVRPVLAEPNAQASADDRFVEIVLADGRVIKAEILEETPTEYRVMAYLMEGFPAVETTYRKSMVTEIRRGVTKPGGAAPEQAGDSTIPQPKDTAKPKVAEGAAQIVLTNVDGQVGFDFSPTPLLKFFRMVDEQFADIGADGKVRSEHRKDHIVVFKFNTETNPNAGIDGMFSIMDIKNIMHDEINKGRRIVFWIQRGVNGAAVLPMMSPEIYFTTRGIMVVTSDLEDFQFGDEVVREKQISLRQGHAEGFPILGGYHEVGPVLVRAMIRRMYEFWYKKEGGKVFARNDPPPADELDQWIQLSDDGAGPNKDDPDDINELWGNDRVWLDATRAYDLGISRGVADTLDDLAFHLGVGRNYQQVLKDEGEDLFRRWRNELERALAQIHPGDQQRPRGELWRAYDKAGELPTPQAQLGRQKNSLEKIVGYLRKYQEVLDPNRQQIANLEVQIELLRQQIMQINRQN